MVQRLTDTTTNLSISCALSVSPFAFPSFVFCNSWDFSFRGIDSNKAPQFGPRMEAETVQNMGLDEPGSVKREQNLRVEIDTSAPFESVKEAVNRFGGIGFWKPTHNNLSDPFQQDDTQEHDTRKLEEEAAVLEKELFLKERETLDILKELESTKRLVEDLKSKLQEEGCETNLKNKEEDKENQVNQVGILQNLRQDFNPSSKPGLILQELKQAKLNLTRTTNDLADVRASVVSLNTKLQKERVSLEKTRKRLTHSSSKLSSLEEELNQTRLRLQVAKDDPSEITKVLQRLSSEAEHFKRMGEAAKSEVLRTMSEIEQTKTMIRTAELRLVAARKMKEAARAAESACLAEINALSNNFKSSSEVVTLSFEEYSALTSKALEAEENSKRRVTDAMLQVDEANLSETEILKRVEEATKEVKTCKKALEEAMERVEAANRGKVAVEEVLKKKGHKRRPSSSIHNSTKFKNSHHRTESHIVDVNELNVVDDEAKPYVSKSVLSIGEILRRKLLLSEEFEAGSLGHMLGKQKDDSYFSKQFCTKRRKFGFARFSHLLAKQQKKKKPTLNLR